MMKKKKQYIIPEIQSLPVYDRDIMDDVIASSTITYDPPMGKDLDFEDEDSDDDIYKNFGEKYDSYKVFK